MDCLRQAFRPLVRLYGPLPVTEFDSTKLEALQGAMASGAWLNEKERKAKGEEKRPIGLARTTVNRHCDRIKRLFRWGCVKRIVPADHIVNLTAVRGLKLGRSAAREAAPVTPVDPPVVEKKL